jgi:hypothetical protein
MHPHASLLSLSCDQPHSTCVGYSEVCKESIQMYRKHFPTHPNLGDVTKISWNQQKQGTIDLLVGGSPCQNLTTANNLGSNNGLQGKKSGLFFHYCRLFREMGCRYFILENVSRMKKESLHEITKQLQTLTPLKVNKYVQLYLFPNSFTLFNTVQILSNTVKYCQILSNTVKPPIACITPVAMLTLFPNFCFRYLLNSADFSGQRRRRFFWTNVPLRTQIHEPRTAAPTLEQILLVRRLRRRCTYLAPSKCQLQANHMPITIANHYC